MKVLRRTVVLLPNITITVNQPLLAPAGYGVASIAVANPGAGYIGPPVVMISGGSGTGATAIASVDVNSASPTYGQVTGITVTSPGSGYQYTDALTVTLLRGGYTTLAQAGAPVLTPNLTTGGLTKTGAGTLTLGAANTYGGNTTVAAGTLKLGVAGALPAGSDVVLAGGTLDLNGQTVTAAISGSGVVSNGTVVTVLSPAGEGALGTDSPAFRNVSVSGTYFADVTPDGSSDLVAVQGNINVSGLSLQIVDTDALDRHKQYTIMTCTGALTGTFASHNLPDGRWSLFYGSDGSVKLIFVDGTLIKIR
jgi:autotransporter-associated beta strand protein